MRLKSRMYNKNKSFKIIALDDESFIIRSLAVVLEGKGYHFEGYTDHNEVINKIREDHYDLLILDYLLDGAWGNQVVEIIREFNKDLYILLLTGQTDSAPPLETLNLLDIQGYCVKDVNYDQLLLQVQSAQKAVNMMKTIKKTRDGLNKILLSVPKIYQLQPIGNILEWILSEIMLLVNSQNAFIIIDDINNNNIRKNSIFRGIGKYDTQLDEFMMMLDHKLMERIGISRNMGVVSTMESGVILPLSNEFKKTIGVIYIESQSYIECLSLLKIFASQATASLNNAILHSMVNTKREELNKTYEELKNRYMDTIEALRLTVDAKDVYTRGHSDRVAFYAGKIGMSIGLSKSDLEILKVSGIFHDIGKIGTSDDILLKSEELNAEEIIQIRKHPLKGAHILSAISMFSKVVPHVKYHHERMDGKGYPDGLVGEEIPVLTRILSIADAFDAMTSDRNYRSKLSLNNAILQLKKNSGTQFDSDMVDKFIEILNDFHNWDKELSNTYN